MATYTKVYNNPYPDGWKDGKDGKTPITADILNNQTETLESIEQYLEDNPIEQGGGGSGESGTTNYEDLTNKPSINGTELKGDVTLNIPEKTSDLTNDSGFLTDIKGKSYNDLLDKPQINGIDLQGNLTVEELGLLDITESTDTTLENSKDGVLKIKEIYGNTIQDGTPTPDAPIEIKSVVLSEIKTCGKNLAKIHEAAWTVGDNYITNKGANGGAYLIETLNLKANTTYYIRLLLLSKPTTDTTLTSYINDVASIYSFSGLQNYDLNKVYTATYTPTQDEKLSYKLWGNSNSDIFNFQFWVSTDKADKTYEPYTESVATLSNPITLNGLNGVQDTLESKKFKEVVFDGSESGWVQASDGTFRLTLSDYKYHDNNTANYKATQLNAISIKDYTSNNAPDNSMIITDGSLLMCKTTTFTTLDEWKAHLASKPMKVTYELTEPIETPLPEADVEALKSLKTYDGVTHIFTDSEVEPDWLLEYNTTRVGTELDKIDAELAKINKRITDIGTTAQINYSTEEQVVGTWIDGRPIYQKTITDVMPQVTDNVFLTHSIDTGVENLDFMVNSQVCVKQGDISILNTSYLTNAGLMIKHNYNVELNKLNVISNASAYSNSILYVTIQYTKTTDTV